MKSSKEELLSIAQELPVAERKDFTDWSDHQGNERIITDSKLRTQLVNAGLAVGVQSPKGKQQIASIIRLLPDGARLEPTLRRAKQQLPTLDDLRVLINKIDTVEEVVEREMAAQTKQDIISLKDQLAEASLHDAERIHAELGKAFEANKNRASLARLESLRRVGDDQEFPQRVFLSLIAC